MSRGEISTVNNNYRDFNDFLKLELKRQHVSQQKLSEWLNFNSRQALVDRLSGATEWKFRETLEVCDLLEVDPADIFRIRQRGNK